jgi:hypothetical protein
LFHVVPTDARAKRNHVLTNQMVSESSAEHAEQFLPDDAAYHIFSFLSLQECLLLRGVCKSWQELIKKLTPIKCKELKSTLKWGNPPYYIRQDLRCSNSYHVPDYE